MWTSSPKPTPNSTSPQAVDAVITAYRRDGLEADAEVRSPMFARLTVNSATESAKVELSVDWRKNKPILLAVGPVLHADDAVANKVCALFGRAEVRDYVDVAAILGSGRYSEDDLGRLAAEHDQGFDSAWFAEALGAVDRLPDTLFAPYGLGPPGCISPQGSDALLGREDQPRVAAEDRLQRPGQSFSSCRAITMRWIWLVPS
jgi:hypothetical protein